MNKDKLKTGEDLDDFLEEVLENALTPDEDSAVQDLIDVVTFKNRTIILNDVKNNYTGSQIYQNILIWNILDAGKFEKEPIKIYIDSFCRNGIFVTYTSIISTTECVYISFC